MVDLSSAREFLRSVRYPGCSVSEQTEYIQAHLTRIFDTFRIVDRLQVTDAQTVLDIGAKPYMLAALVKKYSPAKFVGVGYSIEEVRDVQHSEEARSRSGHTGPVPIKSAQIVLTAEQERSPSDSRQSITDTLPIEMWQCNVETDPLPIEDNSMDVVVFSEILEHLIFNPSLVIAEMNRVLKIGGTAIVTTPNQLYWVRLMKLLLGKNIDDPYSIHGPYGRHNRNYLPKEINRLYVSQGFKLEHWTSKTFLPLSASRFQKVAVGIGNAVFSLWPTRKGKQYVGVFKKVEHKPKPQYPSWLYH